MARPTKQGLDYFSLDVEMDDETEIIKAEHGMAGFGILIAMFQSIYKDKGYYRKWDKRNQILFSKRVSEDKNLVVDVINGCINWDIFNKEMYETHQILTSNRIQRQYINATYKRKVVKLKKEYLLVDDEFLDRENITCCSVSDVKNPTDNEVNDPQELTKYKDKESISKVKGNNNVPSQSDSGDRLSIEKKENGQYDYPNDYERIYEEYPYKRGTKKAGWRKWAARRREGVPNQKLMEAAQNYAHECKAEKRDKKYVQHISTFFGPDEHWREYLPENYEPPKSNMDKSIDLIKKLEEKEAAQQ